MGKFETDIRNANLIYLFTITCTQPESRTQASPYTRSSNTVDAAARRSPPPMIYARTTKTKHGLCETVKSVERGEQDVSGNKAIKANGDRGKKPTPGRPAPRPRRPLRTQ
ncbi:hypothetical protein EVAR_68404_1 [Eumeta japonica]|uniref:Uncharacterized protein n=1 Tax=Eumeta variegata TaxID=151549 RepID=A0A4C2A431_EUMVA|nr:hypothetical protein EVAR_68404_1 [Eumeta japonica]